MHALFDCSEATAPGSNCGRKEDQGGNEQGGEEWDPRWVIEVHFFKHGVSRRGKKGIDISNKHRGFFSIEGRRGIVYNIDGAIQDMLRTC